MTNNSKFIAELKLKNIYQDFFIDTDLERFEYDKPHYYFNYFWEQYQQFRDSQRGEDGSASGKWNNYVGGSRAVLLCAAFLSNSVEADYQELAKKLGERMAKSSAL